MDCLPQDEPKSPPYAWIVFGLAGLYFVSGYQPPAGALVRKLDVSVLAGWGAWLLPVGVAAWVWMLRAIPSERPSAAIPASRLALAFFTGIVAFVLLSWWRPDDPSLAGVFVVQFFAAETLLGSVEALRPVLPTSRRALAGDLLAGLAAAVAAFPLLSLVFVIGRAIDPALLGSPVFSQSFTWPNDLIERCLAILAIPFCEEILFRMGLLGFLLPRLGAAASIVISAAAFSAMHLQPEIFWARFIAGLFLGWLYVRTGRITPPFALHALMNGAILFLPVFFGS